MNINRKKFKEAENETIFALELYKNAVTGDLEYRSPKGVIVKVADKDGLESLESAVASLESTVGTLPAAPTTTTVNISQSETTYSDGRPTVASGILAMGSSPIELLPAPGVGKYYDIDKVVIEYLYNSVSYTLSDYIYLFNDGDLFSVYGSVNSNSFLGNVNTYFITRGGEYEPFESDGLVYGRATAGNSSFKIGTWNGTNPTLGDGTLRAIITYTLKTFGA